MGGPRRAPGGTVKGERVVHVDDPKVRRKYEELAADAKAQADERATQAEYEANSLRSELLAAKRLLEASEIERLRLSNLKDPETAGTLPNEVVVKDSVETQRLRDQVERLKQALELSRQVVAQLKHPRPEVETEPKTVTVTVPEYRDRVIVKFKRSAAAAVAAVSISLGALGGYAVRVKPVKDAVTVPAPSPSPQVAQKPARAKK